MMQEDNELNNKNNTKQTLVNLKRTWKYAKRNKKQFFGYLLASFFLSAISAVSPLLEGKLLIKLTHGLFNDLIMIAIIIFAVEISRNTFRWFGNKMAQVFTRETTADLQIAMAKETVQLETYEIDTNSSGVFIDRLNKDAKDIAEIFNHFCKFLTDFFSNIGVIIAVFILNKIVFGYFVFIIIIMFLIKRKAMRLYFLRDKKFRELSENNTGLITELIRGLRDIKALNSNTIFLNKVNNKLRKSNQEQYEMLSINRKYNLVLEDLSDVFFLLFILLEVFLLIKGFLTMETGIIIFMYYSKVLKLNEIIAQLIEFMKKFNLSANRVFQVTEDNFYQKEQFGAKVIKKALGNFEFKDVSFAYEGKENIFKDLSFKINANETVAFVGKSGGGKSTIFSLLTRLYTVNNGEILIDGININELTRDSIRENISIITQNPYIFNFTIKENLSIVKENLTEEEMINACKLACIHEFIETLPDKYDTIVGEGGLNLSGGQRQRLAIARALIKQTEIILFDEATSALDNETQKKIQDALNNMKHEYTILMIAHRLSTVINCDRIILIDNGKVIGEGKHEKLLKSNKIYKKLYETELQDNN